MTATATHDTKRGEDSRARLNVLTELAEEWDLRIARWATLNRRFKTLQDSEGFPNANDEYLLYQMILGSWPNALMDTADPDGLQDFCGRVEASAIKSIREAKLQTSWTRPDQAYEDAVINFVRGILDPARSPQFLADFTEFARRVAWFGMLNGLSQTVLRLTLPGVPDTYRGAELWDYAMVDPDNRRPVDFARRIECLNGLRDVASNAEAATKLFESWPDGRIKLLILSRLLRLRRQKPALFLAGGYHALTAEGARGDHLCAFARIAGEGAIMVVVPRFFVSVTDGRMELPGPSAWAETFVTGPAELSGRRLVNVLTGEATTPEERDGTPVWRADVLLGALPFGLWLTEEAPDAANAASG